MQTLNIKNMQIPTLGLGTWRLYGSECTNIVLEALDMGYRHLDTAQYYENEFQVGDAIKQTSVSRDNIFLATKISAPNMNFGHAVQSVENSLRRLQTDYLDLLLLHAPPSVPSEEVLQDLVKLKDVGKVRALGISNYYGDLFNHITQKFDLVTNQIEWSPYVDVQCIRQSVLDAGMCLTAYCPLARGEVLKDAVISDIANKHGKTNAQITLRWLIQHEQTIVIPKSASTQRLRENLEIFNFTLDEQDMQAITLLPKNGRIINGDWLSGERNT